MILATLGYPARSIYDECVKEGKWRGGMEVIGGVEVGRLALTMKWIAPESPALELVLGEGGEGRGLWNETELVGLGLLAPEEVVRGSVETA